jgi:hypothetical protein
MYDRDEVHQRWLELFIAELGGCAGTVHVQREEDLYLTAAHKIPDEVVAIVSHVPHGKGMAGVAQVRKEPVQTCNLQTDHSGNIKPGARAVNAQAAIALPVLDDSGEIRAVVGIAWQHESEISAAEQQTMMDKASTLPQ